jgi:uncharacterized protein YunC (DUF1805 family)
MEEKRRMKETIEVAGAPAEGYVIPMPACNLVFVTKGKALLGCGVLDVSALDKFGVAAIKVTGVASVDDLLNGEVKAVNETAAGFGAAVGQTGREALALCE